MKKSLALFSLLIAASAVTSNASSAIQDLESGYVTINLPKEAVNFPRKPHARFPIISYALLTVVRPGEVYPRKFAYSLLPGVNRLRPKVNTATDQIKTCLVHFTMPDTDPKNPTGYRHYGTEMGSLVDDSSLKVSQTQPNWGQTYHFRGLNEEPYNDKYKAQERTKQAAEFLRLNKERTDKYRKNGVLKSDEQYGAGNIGTYGRVAFRNRATAYTITEKHTSTAEERTKI